MKAKVLSDISRDIAQVLFASVFIAPLLGGTDKPFTIAVGLVFSIIAWYMSMILIKE
ncbi:MAG: hypothetical protein WAP74_03345 [Patescibacteria group bacterium]